MLLTSISQRVWLSGLVYAVGILILSLILGRVFCGWFCPLGASIDFWNWCVKKLKLKILTKEPAAGKFTKIKYYHLALLVVLAAVGYQLAWFLDPIAIFVRTMSVNFMPFINNSIHKIFIFALQSSDSLSFLEPMYNFFKKNIIETGERYYPGTENILLIFLVVILLASIKKRFWCRYVCPLGALLAVPAKFSFLRRKVYECKNGCNLCKKNCRMNAIKEDNSYIQQECIVCMDCIDNCPIKQSEFKFIISTKKNNPKIENENLSKISRARFLSYVAGSAAFLAGCSKSKKLNIAEPVLRPPASLPEEEFVHRCVRCGLCMKVCITNVLQPVLLESGWQGIWTPRLDTKISYCDYKCNLCGQVCPTKAIKPISVEEKMKTKIGLAVIDQRLCIPWAKNDECMVCEEHCPVSKKAIKAIEFKNANGKKIGRPYIDSSLCVGCAICVTKCPVKPKKAIKVVPL